jgi:hypothetical protein
MSECNCIQNATLLNAINDEKIFVRVYAFINVSIHMKLLTNLENALPMEIIRLIQNTVYQMVFKQTTNRKLEEPEINRCMQLQ